MFPFVNTTEGVESAALILMRSLRDPVMFHRANNSPDVSGRRLGAFRAAVIWSALGFAGGAVCAETDQPHVETAQNSTAKDVPLLIEQLGHADRTVRAAAEQRLSALGPEVLPLLPRPGQLSSPAQREAVVRMRELLERQLAQQSVQASRITLQGSWPLFDLVQRIEAQSGNRLSTAELPLDQREQSLSVDWRDVTFWDCIDEIARRLNVVDRMDPDAGGLTLLPEAADVEPTRGVESTGAFRVRVLDVSWRPDFINASRKILRVHYEIQFEPRLRPLFLRFDHANFTLDADGQLLHALDPTARRERPVERADAVVVTSDFTVPEGGRVDRVTFTGRIDAELAAGREEFVFRHLEDARHVVRRSGGVTVTMESAERSREVEGSGNLTASEVNLRVVYDSGGPAFESHRTWVYHNEAFLRSGKDKQRWSPAAFDTLKEEEGAVRLSYHFEHVGRDLAELEFVYVAPTLIVSVPFEFVLRNLTVDPDNPEAPPSG